MLRMLRRVMKGNFVGLLIDLNLPPSQSATVIETFGMKMCGTYLHAVLARRTGARLVPMKFPQAGFIAYVRNPPRANQMPSYSPKVLPDADLADIYAYIRSLPDSAPAPARSCSNVVGRTI